MNPKLLCLSVLMIVACIVGCRFPYEPEPEPEVVIQNTTTTNSLVRVFPVNADNQICNPSISQDTIRFPGCMLWLNFSGKLAVMYPDSLKIYDERTFQHDRLLIVDTTNTVRWCMKVQEIGMEKDAKFQDPEWSTHPDYCISLSGMENDTKKWSAYVINPFTKNYIAICKHKLDETSTPHLWVDKTAKYSGSALSAVIYENDNFADSASVHSFFGTNDVKVVVSLNSAGEQSVYMKDYSVANPALVRMQRPFNRDGWDCESPLVSPDGKWIVFNAYENDDLYETYLQELRNDAKPILLVSEASDPHWWTHPSDPSIIYVVYQEVPEDNYVSGDLAEEKYLQTGELGSTYRQLIRLFTGVQTTSAAVIKPSSRELLVALPTKGGLSPDGRYLCTGYDRAFIVGLP